MLSPIPAPFVISATLIRGSKVDWEKLLQVHIVSSTREVLSTPFCLCIVGRKKLAGCLGSVYAECDPRSPCCSCCAQSCGIVGRKKYD